MDGREAMTVQGTPPYYLQQQGHSGHLSAPQQGHDGNFIQQGYSNNNRQSNPNYSVAQDIVRPAFNVESGPGSGSGAQSSNGPQQGFSITGGSFSEPVKKKRGRPRKYGPDGPGLGSGSGAVSLGLSPSSPSSSNHGDRKKRGRPPGSGRKQRLASVGEWMSNSAGAAFMPHVIHVQPGEDVAEKILAFAQQRPRALCIMSGSGGVSSVSLRQLGSIAGTVTFEGRFEILCLSGSYLVSESGGPRNRSGGVNVSLSSPDGHVIGGAVGGRLVASKPVQVVVCSFIYGSIKGKGKESDEKEEKTSEQPVSDKTAGGPKAVDSKNRNTDIDLANG